LDKNIRKLSKSVCLTQNINPKVGEAILSALFKQLKERCESSELGDPSSFKNFRIINLGLFYSTPEQRKGILNRPHGKRDTK